LLKFPSFNRFSFFSSQFLWAANTAMSLEGYGIYGSNPSQNPLLDLDGNAIETVDNRRKELGYE
jgi:hypothetical protein